MGHRVGHPIQDSSAQFGVLHLSSSEHDRDLDLASLAEEPLDLPGLGGKVADPDLGPVLHLLDQDTGGLLSGLLGLLGVLVLELPVVHDPANRRVRLIRHLHQIQAQFLGHGQGFVERPDPDLLTVRCDQSNLTGQDLLVDPGFPVCGRCYCPSLLCVTHALLVN